MNSAAYQSVPIACPQCNNRFVTPVITIVDVGQHPQLKGLLLSGQLNVAACPQCGYAGMLGTPLVYHDPEKELFFTHIPPEMGVPELEQQRLIGDLTNRVISALPAEGRKGYLLRPRSFLRLEGLIEAVLEADGVTPEMLEAQRARAALLDRLLRATSDDARRIIVQENEVQIDYEFFQLLSLNIELAAAEGQEPIAQQLLHLREQLLEWSSAGQEVAAREQAIRELGDEITREELLQKLVAAALAGEAAKIETMVTFARPAIDYVFYQQLTERIEAAEQAGDSQEAQTLRDLRQTILEIATRIDAELEEAAQETNRLLQKILDSDDLEKALLANLDQIDNLFLEVMANNLEAAEQAGNTARVEKLQQIGNILMAMIRQSQPPELAFINELLSAEFPGDTQALLEANRQHIDARLLAFMQRLGQDLASNGREELAGKLAQIEKQAAALVS